MLKSVPHRFKKVVILWSCVSVLCLGTPCQAQTSAKETEGPSLKVDLIQKAIDLIQKNHVEKVSESKLVEAALNGMLQSLDAHGAYLSPKIMSSMQESVKGSFGGLGVEVTMEHGFVKVVTALDQSPAMKAGLEAGDYITHINKELLLGLTFDQAVEKMRGPLNSTVTLTIKREGRDFFDVPVVRSEIKYQPVRYSIYEGVGYLRISTFLNGQTAQIVKEALEKMGSKKSGLKGLILDLRNNPGGLLSEAVGVSSLFLGAQEIVSTRGQHAHQNERFKGIGKDLIQDVPMVVLINAGSASASEIVAGALQDHHRAVVMGTPSFGKGSVQSVIPLPQDMGAFSITVARYYTPSGRCIQARGIQPDVLVEQALVENISDLERKREKDIPLALKPDDWVQMIKSDLKREHLQSSAENYARDKGYGPKPQENAEKEKDQDKIPKAFRDPYPPLPKPETLLKSQPDLGKDIKKDYQLARAFDLLKGLSIVQKQKKG